MAAYLLRVNKKVFPDHIDLIKYEFSHMGNPVVRTIEVRKDPLFGHYSSLISPERVKRPHTTDVEERRTDESTCIFCPPRIYQVTPEPKKRHKGFITYKESEKHPVLSVPNLFPFGKPHYVTVFKVHEPDLMQLDFNDMEAYLESGCEIAREIKGMEGVFGMWDIINWGYYAAASQIHPHAQRGGLTRVMMTEMDIEYERYGRLSAKDQFNEYMSRIRGSDLFGWESELLFINAPFAPKVPDQVDVIVKPQIRNMLELYDLGESKRCEIARSMLGILHLLDNKRGVTDLNVITHQARFDQDGSYRLHWHILPRNKRGFSWRWGGMEMEGAYVVDVYPDETAAAIRDHYHVSAQAA